MNTRASDTCCNRDSRITGPDLLGTRELAQLVSEVTGKPIEVSEMSASAALRSAPPKGTLLP